MRINQSDLDDISAAMLGIVERFSGSDPVNMGMVRALSDECARIVASHSHDFASLRVELPPIFGMPPRGGRL